ncbi:hypothetical protein HB774_32960 (plasmid) [Rhizobium leguminosarum bv. viciae]|nr:hypothetical protein HB774_32960 [Rhizobium leguminosarum bv. viciae]
MMRTSEHRLNELDGVFERRSRALLLERFTDDVVVAFDASPLGPHNDKTARVVRALGRAAIAGKEIVISLGENGPWGIGRIVLGEPGNFVRLPHVCTSYDEALRRVFAIRRQAFFSGSQPGYEASEIEEVGGAQ